VASTVLVVSISVGSAFAFAVSTNLKHSSAAQLPALPQLSVRRLGRFVHTMATHPLWVLGILADVLGLGLQVVALHLGALAVVQPLLISGLLFSLLLRHLRLRNLRPSDFGWATLLALSLGGFLLIAGTASGAQPTDAADRLPALIAALVGLGVGGSSIAAARRLKPAVTAAALLGAAVGLLYAADAALLKVVTDKAVLGVTNLLSSWQLYAVIVVGALGLVLCQMAYQAGPLTASQPTIAVVDPLASVVIGVLIFDEHLRRGPWTGAGLVVLVLVLAMSIVGLARQESTPVPVGFVP
jgi:drug/metabolite transporter (DMT)-like permease